MSTSAHDSTMTNSRDLESLRTRLWRLSSMLTCGVLVVALVGTWVANAAIANSINTSALLNQFAVPVSPEILMSAFKTSKPNPGYALEELYRQNAIDSSAKDEEGENPLGWSHGYGPDSAVRGDQAADSPFRVAMFEDGSLTFLDAPGLFLSKELAVQLVTSAIEKREEGGPRLRAQTVSIEGHTWMWSTQIAAANPEYDPEDPEGYEITLYASGDLSEYADGGMLAARIFAFVDITPSVTQLKWLALVLGVTGIAGCAVLVLVCRKIIDRALVPVAESQARQREFLIKASHELKTPMASLSSNLDALVSNGGETVASQGRWTNNMREDIDELADRTCKLLDLVTDLEHGDSKA